MNLYCFKDLELTNNSNVKIKRERDGKANLH